jgi:uncharacterized protein (TIGR02594 family)
MDPFVKQVQKRLNVLGFGPLNEDGLQGDLTDAAIIAFKKSVGLRERPYIGPITKSKLFPAMHASIAASAKQEKIPCWLVAARADDNITEIRGAEHNPAIVKMWEDIKLGGIKDDDTPWCAAFVGSKLEGCGIRSTRSGMARSYSKSKLFFRLNEPVLGAIVTFYRNGRSSGQGHVGFVEGIAKDGSVMVRGGNQGDAVNVRRFTTATTPKAFGLDGYFWPVGVPVPARRLVPGGSAPAGGKVT